MILHAYCGLQVALNESKKKIVVQVPIPLFNFYLFLNLTLYLLNIKNKSSKDGLTPEQVIFLLSYDCCGCLCTIYYQIDDLHKIQN